MSPHRRDFVPVRRFQHPDTLSARSGRHLSPGPVDVFEVGGCPPQLLHRLSLDLAYPLTAHAELLAGRAVERDRDSGSHKRLADLVGTTVTTRPIDRPTTSLVTPLPRQTGRSTLSAILPWWDHSL
jgi:hypothetical protein